MPTDELYDDERELEPGPPEEQGAGLPWVGIVASLGLIMVVVFAVQNTDTVSIEYLWMTGDFPLSIVILVTAVASAIFAVLGGAFYRRRRRLRRAEKHELRHLRGDD